MIQSAQLKTPKGCLANARTVLLAPNPTPPGLTPEWRVGVQAAAGFGEKVTWAYDLDSFGQTAPERLKSMALEFSAKSLDGNARAGFLHRLGFGIELPGRTPSKGLVIP
jgi:hypothetical protein